MREIIPFKARIRSNGHGGIKITVPSFIKKNFDVDVFDDVIVKIEKVVSERGRRVLKYIKLLFTTVLDKFCVVFCISSHLYPPLPFTTHKRLSIYKLFGLSEVLKWKVLNALKILNGPGVLSYE